MTDTLPSLPLFVDDYEAATAHLSIEEDGVYMRLLRLCWRTPRCSLPDDNDWIRRRLRIDQRMFERVAVPILDEFFSRARGRVFQKRLLQEFVKANEKKQRRIEAGKQGGSAKALKTKERKPSNATVLPLANAKQNPSSRAGTQHQHQLSSNEDKRASALACPDGVQEQVWRDFIALRKAKRAPLTATALAAIASQAEAAGWSLNDALAECVARGWQGFKAQWVADSHANGRPQAAGGSVDYLEHRLAERRQREQWAKSQ